MSLRGAPSALCCLLGLLACAHNASAQAAPNHERSGGYYALHGGVIGATLAGSLTAYFAFHPAEGADFAWFPGDASLRGRRSDTAVELSNLSITLTVAEPVFAQVGRGVDAHFVNFGVVYGEAVSVNLLLNGLVKLAVRRPRPYTYGQAEAQDPDPGHRNVSFYSGHASTAFAAALAGSLLFAESAPNRASRFVVWGSELALAGATANLRVRAGKHYYSDVVVGALVGSGLGIVVPVLHGARYEPKAGEYIAASGGLLLGMVASQLLPLRTAEQLQHASTSWSVAPWTTPGGLGLAAHGAF